MMGHAFPHTAGKIWIFIPGVVNYGEGLLMFDGRFLIFEHHGKELIPVAKGRSWRKVIEADELTFHPDGGGTICQVSADLMDRSRMEWQ